MRKFLFYLLFAIIPVQLGRHFFFDFSLVGGIYSDYLTPTFYLTDLIIFLFILLSLYSDFRQKTPVFPAKRIPVLSVAVFYLLLNVLFIAQNKPVAVYAFARILEMLVFIFYAVKLKPNSDKSVFFLSLGLLYSSVLGIWQFIAQKSIGGFFWFLGERSFSLSTPSIAAISINGGLLLRSYSSFPHPNVFGGFLVLGLTAVFYLFLNRKISNTKKIYFYSVFFVGIIALILTFSKLSWVTGLMGLLLVYTSKRKKIFERSNKKRTLLIVIFYTVLVFSLLFPLLIPKGLEGSWTSMRERKDLIEKAINLSSSNWLTGVGLNNSVNRVREIFSGQWGMHLFQPVHNIFLLVLVETGITGFSVFITFFISMFFKSSDKKPLAAILLIEVLILGLFDHYLLTLVQGMLMFTIVIILAISPQKT